MGLLGLDQAVHNYNVHKICCLWLGSVARQQFSFWVLFVRHRLVLKLSRTLTYSTQSPLSF